MSLTENDRVMVYGNKAERLPTLAELSEYFNSNTSGNAATVEATNVSVEEDAVNGVDAGTLQATISALANRIRFLEIDHELQE